MVGFVRELEKEDSTSISTAKPKASVNNSESYNFDISSHFPELDDFSFTPVESSIDFDCIKDWIEEMQDPSKASVEEVSTKSVPVVESSHLNTSSDSLLVNHAVSGSLNDSCGGIDGHVMVGGNSIGAVDSMADSNKIAESGSFDGVVSNCDGEKLQLPDVRLPEAESGVINGGRIDDNGNSAGDKPCDEELGDINFGKPESMGCNIEERLQKVSLVGGAVSSTDTVHGTTETAAATVSEDDDSESSSDSESESEASSSSSSDSSSSGTSVSDDDEAEEEEGGKGTDKCSMEKDSTEKRVDVEDGEIMGSDTEKMVSWSDNDESDDDKADSDVEVEEFEIEDVDDEDDVVKGPIKSKNELSVLPPVPPVEVTLQPHHDILPVGVVSSILGPQVVVEGSEKHNPLSEGSIVWITEKRLPLGRVDEIFGPVKTPFYIVRFNSESEVPSEIQNGTHIGFVLEFVGHVLNDKNLYQKGYDASGENDEELSDVAEFSDDEKEAEYRRMLKMSKRGQNNQGTGNKKKNRKNLQNRDKPWTKDRPSTSEAPPFPTSQHNQMQRPVTPPLPPSNHGNQSVPSPAPQNLTGPAFPQQGQPPFPQQGQPPFPQQAQPNGFMPNNFGVNGMPFQQQQNMALPNGFQLNALMPWLQQMQQMPSAHPALFQQQQFLSQLPLGNMFPSSQPFDLSQLVTGNSAMGNMNFAGGAWPGGLPPNMTNQVPPGLPNSNVQFPMFQGTMPNAPPQAGNGSPQPNSNFSGNTGGRPQFNQGFSSSGGGRGRGRKQFQQRGGRFGGGRGRQ